MADDAKCQAWWQPGRRHRSSIHGRRALAAIPTAALVQLAAPFPVGYWSQRSHRCAACLQSRYGLVGLHPSPPKQLLPLELSRYLARRVGSRAATALAEWPAVPPPPPSLSFSRRP